MHLEYDLTVGLLLLSLFLLKGFGSVLLAHATHRRVYGTTAHQDRQAVFGGSKSTERVKRFETTAYRN
jgi:hypothetical protein